MSSLVAQVCVLYGLNEGMCDFDSHFENVVTGTIGDESRPKMALKRSVADSACYYDLLARLTLLKHVDDGMIVAGEKESDKFIEDLGAYFLLKPSGFMKEGSAQKFLGRWFERVPLGFQMWSDEALLKSLLNVLGLESCSGVATPGVKAEMRIENEEPLDEAGVAQFRTC